MVSLRGEIFGYTLKTSQHYENWKSACGLDDSKRLTVQANDLVQLAAGYKTHHGTKCKTGIRKPVLNAEMVKL
jgi:hypothetical protein